MRNEKRERDADASLFIHLISFIWGDRVWLLLNGISRLIFLSRWIMVFVSLTKSCAHKNRYWWMWRKINWTFVRFHVKTVHREYFRSIEIYVANIILIFVSKNLFFYFKQNVAINSHLQTRVWPFQGVNFINILCTPFSHKSVLHSFSFGFVIFGKRVSVPSCCWWNRQLVLRMNLLFNHIFVTSHRLKIAAA